MQAGCFVLIIVVLIEGTLEVEPPGSFRASLHLGAVLGTRLPGPLNSYSECRRSLAAVGVSLAAPRLGGASCYEDGEHEQYSRFPGVTFSGEDQGGNRLGPLVFGGH